MVFNMYKENQEVLIIGVYHTSQDTKIYFELGFGTIGVN